MLEWLKYRADAVSKVVVQFGVTVSEATKAFERLSEAFGRLGRCRFDTPRPRHPEEAGVGAPPLHPRCRCAMMFDQTVVRRNEMADVEVYLYRDGARVARYQTSHHDIFRLQNPVFVDAIQIWPARSRDVINEEGPIRDTYAAPMQNSAVDRYGRLIDVRHLGSRPEIRYVDPPIPGPPDFDYDIKLLKDEHSKQIQSMQAEIDRLNDRVVEYELGQVG